MAQYALLINGAAASAIIAYLSKEHINPEVLAFAPVSLILYAAGVVASVLGMFCMTESLDYYSASWRLLATGEPGTERQKALGDLFWWLVRIAVFISILCFAAGSVLLAHALLQTVPPPPPSCF